MTSQRARARLYLLIMMALPVVACQTETLVGHFHESGTVLEVVRQLRAIGMIEAPAIFAYVGEERPFQAALMDATRHLPDDWKDRVLIIPDGETQEAAIASALPPRFVFGVSTAGEIAHLPFPMMNADSLREFTGMLESEVTLVDQVDQAVSELRRRTEAGFQDACATDSASRSPREYVLFWDVCLTCATGVILRDVLSRAEAGDAHACVAVPSVFTTLTSDLRFALNVDVYQYDESAEPMRGLLFQYRILSDARPLEWRK